MCEAIKFIQFDVCAIYVCADPNSALLKYRMDTSMGSGGAPVFKENNGKLCLVAMHVGNDGSKPFKYNCGVLMSEVLKHMKKDKHSSSKIASLRT